MGHCRIGDRLSGVASQDDKDGRRRCAVVCWRALGDRRAKHCCTVAVRALFIPKSARKALAPTLSAPLPFVCKQPKLQLAVGDDG